MRQVTIRKDSHGLYVRTNDCVYRPERSVSTYPMAYHIREGYLSKLQEGTTVRIAAIAGTPSCKVKHGDREEIWNSHGNYFDVINQKNMPTDDVWQPVGESQC